MYRKQMRQPGPNNIPTPRCNANYLQKRGLNERRNEYQPQAKTATFCNECNDNKYPGKWMTKEHQTNISYNNDVWSDQPMTNVYNHNNTNCFQTPIPQFPTTPNDTYPCGASGGRTFNSQFPQPWGYQSAPMLPPPWQPFSCKPGFQNQPCFSQNLQALGSTNHGKVLQSTTKETTSKTNKPVSDQLPDREQPTSENIDLKARREAIKKVVKENRVFVAANVHGIISWSQLKPQVLPTFELIGRLDSQVTTIGEHSKSFVMKDGQDQTIECVFYETDRKLSTLRRGRMYRCVGEYNTKKRHLLCVSVRETSSEEVQSYRKLIATCNKSLKQRIGNQHS